MAILDAAGEVEDEGTECIAGAMSYNTCLKELVLQSESFVCLSLKRTNRRQHKINAVHYIGNHIGDKGAKSIAEMLRSNNTLKSLDLNGFYQ